MVGGLLCLLFVLWFAPVRGKENASIDRPGRGLGTENRGFSGICLHFRHGLTPRGLFRLCSESPVPLAGRKAETDG